MITINILKVKNALSAVKFRFELVQLQPVVFGEPFISVFLVGDKVTAVFNPSAEYDFQKDTPAITC